MTSRKLLVIAAAAVTAACATTSTPAALEEARRIHAELTQAGADQTASGEMLRARDAITQAETAVEERRTQEYTDGLAHIALRTAQTAEAANARIRIEAGTDSLRTARLNRLVSLSQAQRDSLAAQNQLSQQEISSLREQNVQVSQQADSLRRAAEEANARLNQAMMQLRSLVVEITNLQETSRGLVISLSDILFDVDRATLKAGAEANVRRIAAVLQQYPEHQIVVEGHTDATGSAEYNQTLSERRAAAVREALVAGGVDAGRITSRGFGKGQPVATNDTPAGRQQNRRVEVVVLGAGSLADAVAAPGDTVTRTPPR
ncbi:MAG: OmpA family protein [Gemmatimonadota bacterium]|nr:OmpA family protein [Gemmatimonadota bacterium]